MPRLRYQVAASLDGFIAGPDGEYDWIPEDPSIDMEALYEQFCTLVMGRKTYQTLESAGHAEMPGKHVVVFSRTLAPESYPQLEIVSENQLERISALKQSEDKDIWLFGGGALFTYLADAGLVDTVEIAVVPVLLGSGLQLAPRLANRVGLTLTRHVVYPSGIVLLEYDVARA